MLSEMEGTGKDQIGVILESIRLSLHGIQRVEENIERRLEDVENKVKSLASTKEQTIGAFLLMKEEILSAVDHNTKDVTKVVSEGFNKVVKENDAHLQSLTENIVSSKYEITSKLENTKQDIQLFVAEKVVESKSKDTNNNNKITDTVKSMFNSFKTDFKESNQISERIISEKILSTLDEQRIHRQNIKDIVKSKFGEIEYVMNDTQKVFKEKLDNFVPRVILTVAISVVCCVVFSLLLQNSTHGRIDDISSSVSSVDFYIRSIHSLQQQVKKDIESTQQLIKKEVESAQQQIRKDVELAEKPVWEELGTAKDQIGEYFKSAQDYIGNYFESFQIKLTNDFFAIQKGFEETFDLSIQHFQFVIDQTVAEAHITRDVCQKKRNIRNKYTFGLPLDGFTSLENSGKAISSRLWYIDQFKSHIKGYVEFTQDRKIEIWIVQGRNANLIGLEPGKVAFDAKVFAVKRDGKKLELGSKKIKMDESEQSLRADGWKTILGSRVALKSCSELNSGGFVESDKVALLFNISII